MIIYKNKKLILDANLEKRAYDLPRIVEWQEKIMVDGRNIKLIASISIWNWVYRLEFNIPAYWLTWVFFGTQPKINKWCVSPVETLMMIRFFDGLRLIDYKMIHTLSEFLNILSNFCNDIEPFNLKKEEKKLNDIKRRYIKSINNKKTISWK